MKLLIVDDENRIRNGLCRHFIEPRFGFEAVETAENGLVALEKARVIKPDIILADICMPGMDGLEFIGIVSEELPAAKTIIISGHDDFSYAQKAIRYGVLEYLLKPIDLNQLDLLIKKVCGDIFAQSERQSRVSFALSSIDKSKDVLINDLFMRIIDGKLEKAEAEYEASQMGVSIPRPAGYMVIKIVDNLPQNPVVWELDLLFYAIKNIIDEVCACFSERIFFIDAKNNLMFLFPYNENDDCGLLAEEITRAVETYVGYEIKIDTSVLENTCENLPEAYQSALRRLFRSNEFSQIVVDAKAYIEQNYGNEALSLQEVAEAVLANPSYLSKLMNKQLGMSFVDYLTGVRMQKAVLLLSTSEKDIKLYEISRKIGYSSQHYFSRVFSKYYGMSPIQYRTKGEGRNA